MKTQILYLKRFEGRSNYYDDSLIRNIVSKVSPDTNVEIERIDYNLGRLLHNLGD